jgi:hypothetical protein
MEPAESPAIEAIADELAGTSQVSEPSVTLGDDTFHAGMSIDQAATVLKASASTVRRWVKEGRLRSDRVTTPQAHAFRVYLDRQAPSVEPSMASTGDRRSAPSSQERTAPSVESATPPSMERAEAMTKYN